MFRRSSEDISRRSVRLQGTVELEALIIGDHDIDLKDVIRGALNRPSCQRGLLNQPANVFSLPTVI